METLFNVPPVRDARQSPPGEYAMVRRSDPETSKEAAVAAAAKLTKSQEFVALQARLLTFKFGPFTDEQLVNLLAGVLSPSGVRSRRAELTTMGRIEHVGFSTTSSGNRCRTWRWVG